MIRRFRDRKLKRLFDGDPARINPALRERLENVLAVLDASSSPRHLDLPGYRLHQLKGAEKGLWSVTISGNWRLVFPFEDGDAIDVDLVDYH